MMEDSLTKEGRTLGRTRTITHLLQIIINVRLVGTLIVVFKKKIHTKRHAYYSTTIDAASTYENLLSLTQFLNQLLM